MNNDGWVKVNATSVSEYWDENANKEFTGKYLRKEERNGKFGLKFLYIFQVDKEGKEVGVNGGTVLDKNFANIQPNTWVKIVYLGKMSSPKSTGQYKNYDVFIKPANTPAPTEVPATPAKPAESNGTGDDLPF